MGFHEKLPQYKACVKFFGGHKTKGKERRATSNGDHRLCVPCRQPTEKARYGGSRRNKHTQENREHRGRSQKR